MLDSNPYPGPRPFDPSERHLFFGRTEFIQELVDLVQTYPVTLLYGRSGTGKTSVVRAGLESELRTLGVQATYVRLAPDSGVDAGSFVGSLREALCLPGLSPGAEWTNDIVPGPAAGMPDAARLIIIDQAEELFLAQGDVTGGCRDAIRQLADRTTQINAGRLAVLFVFREDALASFDELSSVLPHGTGIRLRLSPLDAAKGREAVQGPAVAADSGLLWGPDAVALVCESVARRDGSLDALVLQCVCRRVWQECAEQMGGQGTIRVTQVEEFGSITDALRVYVRDAVRDVSVATGRPSHAILSDLERWFVQDGQRKPLILHPTVSRSSAELPLLRSLAGKRLLIEHQASETIWFELSHEGLVASVMREAETQDPSALVKRALEAEARRWVAGGQSGRHLLPSSRLAEARKIARADGVSLELRQFVQRSTDRTKMRVAMSLTSCLLVGVATILMLVLASAWAENRALSDVNGVIEWLQAARNQNEAELFERSQRAFDVLQSAAPGGAWQSGLLRAVRAAGITEMLGIKDQSVDLERQAERLRLALAASMPWDDGITRWRTVEAVTAVRTAAAVRGVLLGTANGTVYRLSDLGNPLFRLDGDHRVVALTETSDGVLAIGQSGDWVSMTSKGRIAGRPAVFGAASIDSASSDEAGSWISLDDGRVCRVTSADRWTCSPLVGVSAGMAHPPSSAATVLQAPTATEVLRYARTASWIEEWSLRGATFTMTRISATSKIQSVARWPGVFAAGSSRHVVQLFDDSGGSIGELRTGATPTAMEIVPNINRLLVGTYKGQILSFDSSTPAGVREPLCSASIAQGGRATDPVVSLTAISGDSGRSRVIALTKSGLASVVESDCSILQQTATGLPRIDEAVGRSAALRVAISAGSDIATLDPDLVGAGATPVTEPSETVSMAGAVAGTWPVLLRKQTAKRFLILGQASNPSGSVPSMLFGGEEPLDSVTLSVKDRDYIVIGTKKHIFVANTSDVIAHPDRPKMFVMLEPSSSGTRIEAFNILGSSSNRMAAVAVGPGADAGGTRLVYFADLARVVSELAADFKMPQHIQRDGHFVRRQLEAVMKMAGSREWQVETSGAVLGSTDDRSGAADGRAVLSGVRNGPGRWSYEVVNAAGRRMPITGVERELAATKGVAPLVRGFAVLDTEGTISRIGWSATAPDPVRVLGSVPGPGCAITAEAEQRLIVAGGKGASWWQTQAGNFKASSPSIPRKPYVPSA